MSFTYTANVSTPFDDSDEDLVFQLGTADLPDKAALNRLETALAQLPVQLCKLTADELKTGKKPFADNSARTLVVYTGAATNAETGESYGRHVFEFPNQSAMAREYLRGMLEGAFDVAGFKGKGKRLGRVKGRRA